MSTSTQVRPRLMAPALPGEVLHPSKAAAPARVRVGLLARDLTSVQRVITILTGRGYELDRASVERHESGLRVELVVETSQPDLLAARIRHVASVSDVVVLSPVTQGNARAAQ